LPLGVSGFYPRGFPDFAPNMNQVCMLSHDLFLSVFLTINSIDQSICMHVLCIQHHASGGCHLGFPVFTPRGFPDFARNMNQVCMLSHDLFLCVFLTVNFIDQSICTHVLCIQHHASGGCHLGFPVFTPAVSRTLHRI
jgi:hypothetical protein